MSENPGGDMMPDYVTNEDLKASAADIKADIKEHINLLIKPIIKDVNEHEIILTGPSKMNGLVGGLRNVQTKLKVVYTLLVFIAAGFVKLIFFS